MDESFVWKEQGEVQGTDNLDVVAVGLSTRWHSFSLLYFILLFFQLTKINLSLNFHCRRTHIVGLCIKCSWFQVV